MAMISVWCLYSCKCFQSSHTLLVAAFLLCRFFMGFCVFFLNLVWFKKVNNCDSASIPDLNNAESLSTKFNGREGPRLSSLDLKIFSFSLDCLTKWPTPAKLLPHCVGWMAIQILSIREVQTVMLGKNSGGNLRYQVDLRCVFFSGKQRDASAHIALRGCLNTPACFWRGSCFQIHWVFLNISLYKLRK